MGNTSNSKKTRGAALSRARRHSVERVEHMRTVRQRVLRWRSKPARVNTYEPAPAAAVETRTAWQRFIAWVRSFWS